MWTMAQWCKGVWRDSRWLEPPFTKHLERAAAANLRLGGLDARKAMAAGLAAAQAAVAERSTGRCTSAQKAAHLAIEQILFAPDFLQAAT